jgi:hypothetical protein
MHKYSLLVVIFLPVIALAQHKYDYTWMFGPPNPGLGTLISFNTNQEQLKKGDFAFAIGTGTAMISDGEGKLQYYSAGCHIANGQHTIVPGADTLNPGWWYDNYCFNGFPYPSGSQSMIFLPVSNNSYNFIYKYRNREILGPGQATDINDTIYIARLDSDTLSYINKAIFNDTLSYGKMVAVKHENNIDYWLITPHDSSNIYFVLQMGLDSIEQINEIHFENISKRKSRGSIAKFNPNGDLYVNYEGNYQDGSMIFFHFSRSNGNLTYLFQLPHVEDNPSLVGGIEFSPSGRYLYVSTRFHIYQYDLEAADVEGSKTLVAEWDGFSDPFPCTFHVMQLGPDCRIYINTSNSQQWLHVIMYPDRPGEACEVRQHHIPLYYYHQISMPYFPNYRLGTGEPVCDSTLALPTSIPIVYVPEGGLRVWPNPARGQVWVGLSEALIREAVGLTLYDMMGRQVLHQPYSGGEVVTVELHSLTPGLYILHVQGRDGRRWTEKLIVE